MTYAVLRKNGDLIWFDAITSFSEKFNGTLSKHPLESGNVINDHTTVDNIAISLSGVISDADFNLQRPTLTDETIPTDYRAAIKNKQFVNNSPVVTPVKITQDSPNYSFLPESVTQYLPATDWLVQVEGLQRPKFALKIKDELTDIQRKAENFSLIDFREGRIWRIIDNCVLVGLDFTETADSGDAIYPVMEIEVARYATTRSAKLLVNKGRKSGNKTIRDKKTGDNPNVEPTTNSDNDSQAVIAFGKASS